ncbi:MAG: cation transporter [Myxococcales bacterium]|jgi:copper chaperone CopZ|nr:cation transporter [Myxococcales bacterium]MBK7195954.1 cation transporter [Myxococcales bacterium]MBP6845410.1 cation transporter [Kofleriaceae bacterium]
MQEFTISIDGMHCMACVRRVKAALEKTPGVVDAVVEVGRARGQVEGASVDDVVTAVTGAGYHAKPE